MDLNEGSALGVFTCELCELSTPYSFFGQKPPNTRAIVLLEECYGMKDPFSPERGKFLVLGSKCCMCSKTVCVGTFFLTGLQSVLHQALLFALCAGSPSAVSGRGSERGAEEKSVQKTSSS